jgi:hypothetical protein
MSLIELRRERVAFSRHQCIALEATRPSRGAHVGRIGMLQWNIGSSLLDQHLVPQQRARVLLRTVIATRDTQRACVFRLT